MGGGDARVNAGVDDRAGVGRDGDPRAARFDVADLHRSRDLLARFDEKVRKATSNLERTYTNRFVDAVPRE